jgi:hypothetical protein
MADFGCGFSLTGAEMGMESIDFTSAERTRPQRYFGREAEISS